MIEASQEITRLCESWWGQLTDNARVDQHPFAEQLLALLGWRRAASLDSRPVLAHVGAVSYLLRGEGETAPVAAHFVMPGALEPPSAVIKRGLDFCETTRLLVNETRALKLDYAYVTDSGRSYLYDARTDELLLGADGPAEFRREIAVVLNPAHVEQGSLDAVRREPRSESARRLREWCQTWCDTIAAESRLNEETGFLAIDRLLVLRFLFEHDILKRPGWLLRRRFSELVGKAFSADPRGCGRQLTGLFHDIWLDWKAGLFSALPALDAVLEQDHVAVPLLKEFALHSRTKFSIAAILESFNYGDAPEKARVRMVPDGNEEREAYLARQTSATVDSVHIEIDLADEGYRAVFHWFDKLQALYQRLETEWDAQARAGAPPAKDVDLFAWSEQAAQLPKALTDRLQYAAEQGITIYYSTPRQLRIARLILYLHLVHRYHQTKQRFLQFPRLDNVFKPRPRVLDSDRKWIYQTRASDCHDWEPR